MDIGPFVVYTDFVSLAVRDDNGVTRFSESILRRTASEGVLLMKKRGIRQLCLLLALSILPGLFCAEAFARGGSAAETEAAQTAAGAYSVQAAPGDGDAVPDFVPGLAPELYELSYPRAPEVLTASNRRDAAASEAQYDSRNSYQTPVRNQKSNALCWAFSALGAMESNMKLLGLDDPNLSELHMGYATSSYNVTDGGVTTTVNLEQSYGNTIADGGNRYSASSYLMRGTALCGAVNEADDPYVDDVASSGYRALSETESKPKSWSALNILFLTGKKADDSPASEYPIIKKAVQEHGAVGASMYHAGGTTTANAGGSEFYSAEHAAYYYTGSQPTTNHAVLIVGWDDSFPKENFSASHQPKSDGAWLVKNSWGANWGDNGYFWISYEDALFPSQCFTFDGVAAFDRSSYTYETDYTPEGKSFSITGSRKSQYLKVFQVSHPGEQIQLVRVFLPAGSMTADVHIVPDFDINARDSITLTDMPDGTVSAVYPGWYTIPVNKYTLTGGNFAVFVTLTASSAGATEAPIGVDEVSLSKRNAAGVKEYWRPIQSAGTAAFQDSDANFCIKALTVLPDDDVLQQTYDMLTEKLIKGNNDDLAHVKLDLNLWTDTQNGVHVMWNSSDPVAVNPGTGAVKPGTADQAVTLTATLSRTGASTTMTKDFELTVIGVGKEDADNLAAAKKQLTWDQIRGENQTRDKVWSNLNPLATFKLNSLAGLAANTVLVSWISSNEAVLQRDGTVAWDNPSETVPVTLTAILRSGTAAAEVPFDLTVWADCAVTYAAGGGSGSMAGETVCPGDQITLLDCAFTPPGKMEFRAWSVRGKTYAPGAKLTITSDTTVTALWTDALVTYDAGGGSGEMAEEAACVGDQITLLDCAFTAPDTAKKFKAWRVGGEEHAPGDKITISGDTTVTAVWTDKIVHTVVWLDGDGSTLDSVTYLEDETPPAADSTKKTPVKAADDDNTYTFSGWDKGTTTGSAATGLTTTYTPQFDTVAKERFDVVFNMNGHGTAPDSITVATGAKIKDKPADPYVTGYTFGGWYKDAACNTKWNFGSDVVTENTTLYADWKVNRYTVTFNKNGHGFDTPQQTVDFDTLLNEPDDPVDPNDPAWEFVHWSQKADGTGVWNFATDTVKNDMTLYAYWVKATRTVTYDLQGHGTRNIPPKTSVNYNDKLTRPTDPGEDGYIFEDWYRDAGFQTKWDFSKDKVTEDITLYAKWTAKEYTVRFDNKGHGTAPADVTVNYGAKLTEPAALAETGWSFGGWYKDAACTSAWRFDYDTVTTSMTLYASWAQITCTVAFDMQGHGGKAPTSKLVNYGAGVAKPTKDPAEDGYAFGGWFTEQSCETEWNFEKDVVTKNTTLYAKWTPLICTVTFNANGRGTAPAPQEVQYGKMLQKPEDPTDPGSTYVFDGWYREAACVNPWRFDVTAVTTDRTLYAKWSPLTYVVTFDVNGHGTAPEAKQIVAGEKAEKPKDPVAAGWTFGGWYREKECANAWNFDVDPVTANTTLYAKWSGVVCTVTFDANGHGKAPGAQTVSYGGKLTRPDDPAADGWVFGGWYRDKSFTSAWSFDTHTVMADATLYAKWTEVAPPVYYTLTFNPNGHGEAPAAQPVLEGGTAVKPDDPAADGWTFGGWYKERACANAWNFDADTVTADTTLYAKWSGIPGVTELTVHFDANGHGEAPADVTVTAGETAARPADPVAAGYVFGGWFTEEECATLWSFDTPVTSDVTLYAKWTKIDSGARFTVSFDANGHGDTPMNQRVAAGGRVTKPADLTAAGWTFGGWYREKDCANAWNFDADLVTEDLTLYAKWSQRTGGNRIVSFDGGGGYGGMDPVEVEDGASYTLPACRFVPPFGSVFDGWDLGAAGAAITVTADVTVTARWRKVSTDYYDDYYYYDGYYYDGRYYDTSGRYYGAENRSGTTVAGSGTSAGLTASVSGSTATVTVSDSELQRAAAAGGSYDPVVIDLTRISDRSVDEAEFSSYLLRRAASLPNASGMSFRFDSGSVTFSDSALSAIADHTGQLTLRMSSASQGSLTEVQRSALVGQEVQGVYALSLLDASNQRIASFGSGTASVNVSISAAAAANGSEYSAYYLSPDGELEAMNTSRSSRSLSFLTEHFSYFVILREKSPAELLTEQLAANPYPDVQKGAFYYDAVQWAASKGIVIDAGSGVFEAARGCTRAEAVAFLWKYCGAPQTPYSGRFDDVSALNWYSQAVEWACTRGVTNGVSPKMFRPQDVVSRAEFMTFLYRAAKASAAGTNAGRFIDVPPDAWYAAPVDWAVSEGITNGVSPKMFRPMDSCTRGEVVTFLYRFSNTQFFFDWFLNK